MSRISTTPDLHATRATRAIRPGALVAAAAAALALSSALTPPAEARGMGGGGGHFGGGMRFGGGGSSFMKMNSFKAQSFKSDSFKVRRHVDSVKPKFNRQVFKKHIEPKLVVRKIVKHEKPAHIARILKHKQKLDGLARIRHVARHKIKIDAVKAVQSAHVARKAKVLHNMTPLHNAMFKLKTTPVKLSSMQYQTAKVADPHGHHYDAKKKMWFDGKHWWRGMWAWLFIDGVWYYGNRPWVEADNGWTTDGPNAPVCVDCTGAPSRFVAGTDSGVTARHAVTKPVTVKKVAFHKVEDDDKPAKARVTSDAKPSLPVETGSLAAAPAAVTCPALPVTSAVTGPRTDDVAGKTGVDGTSQGIGDAGGSPTGEPRCDGAATAASEPAVGSSLAMATGGDEQPTATTAEPAAPLATECRQFVPAIGMTIEVPCGD